MSEPSRESLEKAREIYKDLPWDGYEDLDEEGCVQVIAEALDEAKSKQEAVIAELRQELFEAKVRPEWSLVDAKEAVIAEKDARIKALESYLKMAKEALDKIARWDFDFMADCVADAKRWARVSLTELDGLLDGKKEGKS